MVTLQIKYEWDCLYGSLDVIGGQAHFCQIPAVNQEWDHRYLQDLTLTDLDAIHVVIRDQAGFHLRHNPELNPCEQLWDIIKDKIGNRIIDTVEDLREATLPALRRYWNDTAAVLRLVGRNWLLNHVNATNKTVESY